MRVTTYNIRKCVGLDWRRDPARIIAVLAEIAPDIACLQEADRRFNGRRALLPEAELEAETGLRIAPLPDSGHSHGWHGNVILLRAEAEILDIRPLELPGLEPRGAVMVDFALHGRRVRIVGAHLGLLARDRGRQARAILTAMERASAKDADQGRAGDGAPVEILAGDLNAFRSRGGCIDVLAERLTPMAPLRSFHASRPVAALDRIFVGAPGRVTAQGTHVSPASRRASDHLPVWAEIDWGPVPDLALVPPSEIHA